MIRIAVIEDEKNTQQEIRRNIESVKAASGENVLEIYGSAEEFLDAGNEYDVVITDIELPGISGIELGKLVRKTWKDVYLVFLTSYSEFASESYIIEAYQYILKRDMGERLPALIEKIIRNIKKTREAYRWIGNSQDRRKLYYKDIIYIQKLKGSKYAEYITSDGKCTERVALGQIFDELKDPSFILADRGNIININHIKRVSGNTVYMDQGDEITLSRVQMGHVKEQINSYWRN